MLTDLVLAILHHLLVFGLLAILTYELSMVRVGMSAGDVIKVGRVDIAYGIVAGLVLIVGFLRVFFGAKGPEFYLENHVFWTKVAAFLVIGLLSIKPTLKLISWRNRLAADPAFQMPAAEVKNMRLFMHLEGTVFILIPILAAMMARGYGL
jgi:putative membrane protein